MQVSYPKVTSRIPRRMPLPEAAALLGFVRGLTRCLTACQYSTRHGPSLRSKSNASPATIWSITAGRLLRLDEMSEVIRPDAALG